MLNEGSLHTFKVAHETLHAIEFWASMYASGPQFQDRKRELTQALRDMRGEDKAFRNALADALDLL